MAWKEWFVQKFYTLFSVETLHRKSQLVVLVLKITLLIAVVSLIGVIFAYIDIHVWSKKGSVILVPKEKIIEINGLLYIPIKIV